MMDGLLLWELEASFWGMQHRRDCGTDDGDRLAELEWNDGLSFNGCCAMVDIRWMVKKRRLMNR